MRNIKTKIQTEFVDYFSLIKYPLISDKTTILLASNKYTFIVEKKANKNQIKRIVEYLFNVKILNINTLILPRKTRKIGRFIGYKSQYKKAIITLKPGDKINLFSN